MKIKELFNKMKNTAKNILQQSFKSYKSGFEKAKAASLSYRLKTLKDMASERDMHDIYASILNVDGVQITKSGGISAKGLTREKVEALDKLIIKPKEYSEIVRKRQSKAFDTMIKINRVNKAFERIMNTYYSDWSGKTRIRNSTIDKLPPDFQAKLERMMSTMGKEYRYASDSDFNNIDDEFWEMLEEFLAEYEDTL